MSASLGQPDAHRRPHDPMGSQSIVLLTHAMDAGVAAPLKRCARIQVATATDADTLRREGADASVIIVRAPLPEALFDEAPRLRGVVRQGAGLDMIPLAAAARHGVAVAHVPGVNARSVAEHAVGQMLALARSFPRMDRMLRSHGWQAARQLADESIDLAGKTVAIVGMGAIGQALGRICETGLGMRVLGVRRSAAAVEQEGVSTCRLDDALPQADYLVLACPLNDETRGLIDARRLSALPQGARLVNVARGAVVDEAALVGALARGHLAGAALDVFAGQPLPADSPLLDLPGVLLTPHVAGITRESMRRLGEVAVSQAVDILEGRLPRHFVNHDARGAVLARWRRLDAS